MRTAKTPNSVKPANPKPARLAQLPRELRVQMNGAMQDAVQYAHQLIDPSGVEISSSPSLVARRGLPVRQILEGDIAISQIPFSGTNQFYGEVQADLNNTLLLTTPSSGWEANGNQSYTGKFTISAISTGAFMNGGYMYSDNSNNIMVSGTALESGSTSNAPCFPFVVSTQGTWTASLTQNVPFAEPIRYQLAYTSDGQNWTYVVLVVMSGTLSGTSGSFAIPATTVAISFQAAALSNGDSEFVEVNFRLSNISASGSQRMGRVPKNVTAQELSNISSINGLLSYRITAQDVLGTCQASDLNNGGKLAAARVGANWCSSSSNAYSDLAIVPHDRYDGPFKDGFHVHWLPGSVDDLEPIANLAPADSFGSSKMVFGGTCDTANASLRIKCTTILEFYSLAPQYGNMPFCKPIGYASEVLYVLATQVPAATSNKTHLLRKLGDTVKAHIPAAISWVQQNPQYLVKLGSILASLL